MATAPTPPATTNPPFWTTDVWNSITSGVTAAAAAVRVSQNVFQTVQLSGVTSVPADQFNPKEMNITEGITRPYVELAVEFPLTNGQVNSDTSGTAAITLSKFAARDLALAEDIIILQGKTQQLPPSVKIESGRESLEGGILGHVKDPANIITVAPPDSTVSTNSGSGIWAAIQTALARLTAGTQSQPWAIIADTAAFAAISGSVLNGNPLYSMLTTNGMITGGIYGTAAMPANTAIVIALGGDPTTIYYDNDAVMEPTFKSSGGQYRFRVFERVQTVARDPRAFVKLDFSYLSAQHKK
jgi:hypothetical protein